MTLIRPVILSGGSGSRLWPVSSAGRPKQFLTLVGDESLYASTVDRAGLFGDFPPMVVTGAAHVELVGEASATEVRIVVEPSPRNTAAAIVAAALLSDPDEVLAILPADHLVADPHAFAAAINLAAEMAEAGGIVTLGVVPTRPETGFGWIRIGEEIREGVFVIGQFLEKPPLDDAIGMLASGGHYWNSGVFVAKSGEILAAAKQFAPEVLAAVSGAIPDDSPGVIYLREEFGSAPSVSFDKAIMERLSISYVVPLDAGWDDVGSWVGVWENIDHDSAGNAVRGEVIAVEATNSLIWSSERPIAVVGLDGVVVVETSDGILIAAMDQGQEIRSVVDSFRKKSEEHG